MKSAPFGYKVKVNKYGTRQYVVDHEEAEILEEIFLMLSAGHSCSKIASFLNSNGFKTRNNQIFNNLNVASILKNPFYYGLYRVRENKKSFLLAFSEDRFEEFIESDLWVRVQVKLKNYKILEELLPKPIIKGDIKSLSSCDISKILIDGYDSYIMSKRKEWEELRI